MGLNPKVIDVFLKAYDQTPGDRSGPTGRITDLKNGVTTHYDAGDGKPQRIKVGQRNGFRSLATTGHSSTSGAAETVAWTNPELLTAVGGQELSVANSIPRVYDGDDWTHYGAERVVTNRLSETVYHTSQRTITAPDSAWLSGVTCSVWAERLNPQTTDVVLYVGFKGDDGAWVRTPQVLYAPPALITSYARVVANATDGAFWVVYNALDGGTQHFHVAAFTTNGKLINELTSAQKDWLAYPGYWDITKRTNGILLAQPYGDDEDDTEGVRFYEFHLTAGVIGGTIQSNTSMHCNGPVAFLTNDLNDGNYYIATVGLSEGPGGKLWGYQVTGISAIGHEYNFGVDIPGQGRPDSLIGWTVVGGDDDDEPSLFVSFTVLSEEAQTTGPKYDPQLRYSKVYSCDWADSVTFIRQNDYTCQVSRAFLHDGEYYSINYYQSGSGNSLTSSQITVAWTDGDYMTGSPVQALQVVSGDYTTGGPLTFSAGTFVGVSGSSAAKNITTGDTVVAVVSDGVSPSDLGFPLAPAGTTVLKWTFATNPLDTTNIGGRMVVASSTGVAGANGTWDVLSRDRVDTHIVYTKTTNLAGGSLTPGTFGTAGTASITSMTFFGVPDMPDQYTEATRNFLIGGTAVVSGSSVPANNGTKTIARAGVGTQFFTQDSWFGVAGVWSVTSSEAASNNAFLITLTPFATAGKTDRWYFSKEEFDSTYIDTTLRVGGTLRSENTGDFTVDGAPSTHEVSVSGAGSVPEFFTTNIPTAEIVLPVGGEYTFFLQDVDPDYSYIGATIIVAGDTYQPTNNGTYRITWVDPDPTHHLIKATPTDGRTDYRNQLILSDGMTVSILFTTNVSPEFQPCWLMVPLTGSKPVVGRWEYGIAFSDWRYEGSTPSNPFPLSVSTPVRTSSAWVVVLPYRAISFTVGQTVVTASGQVVNASVSSGASTVGLKQFTLSDSPGLASQVSSGALLPGPMCGEFTASGFHENGINFGLEAPWVISQQTSTNGVGLTKKATYQLQAVAEVTDEGGDRVFSIVSPALNFTMIGDNDSVTYGGRMLQPLGTTGAAVAQHYGVTNYRLLSLALYRTAIQDGVPTTEHHKITLDLNVNGLAPVSTTNDSGFSFPDEFTWNYLDENLDAAILPAEVLYTDKGYLPRFPAPAQRCGIFWKNRSWVIGYDGAVWMSGEKQEGDATWFFPLFRYVLPTPDRPVALAEMDNYMVILCENSIWYLPAATFPDATGKNGTLPAPVRLPFTNGCTGLATTIHAGVVYSSTAGGVWLITRALENKWLSQPVQDKLGGIPVTGLAVDKRQRLYVATGTSFVFVYDQVTQGWAWWNMASSNARFPATLSGEVTFQDNNRVWVYDTSIFYDDLDGTKVAVPMTITFSSLNFGSVRGLKAVWEMQLVGDYKGPHNLTAVISYPDDDPANPTVFPAADTAPYTPDPTAPYLMAINPMIEEASGYGLSVSTDFTGITTPGNSMELELVSAEVGVDPSGLNKRPNSARMQGE